MATEKMSMDQYMKMMEEWFAKLPSLPTNVTDVLVKLAPWLAFIFGMLGVLGALAATGVLAVLSPLVMMGGGFGVAVGGVIGGLLALASSVLMLLAFPGLRDRKMAGWKWSFYSELVSIVGSLVALNLIGAVVSALVGFYILFQIKSYYK
jgi:hypothetical protein